MAKVGPNAVNLAIAEMIGQLLTFTTHPTGQAKPNQTKPNQTPSYLLVRPNQASFLIPFLPALFAEIQFHLFPSNTWGLYQPLYLSRKTFKILWKLIELIGVTFSCNNSIQ